MLLAGRYFVHLGVNRANAAGVALYLNSAIDFCRQTGLWVYDVDPIAGIPYQPIYQIPTPDNSVISICLEMWYGNNRIEGQSIEQLKKRFVHDFRDIVNVNGPPSCYYHEDLCSIRLVPCPINNATDPNHVDYLTGIVALQPSRLSLGLPSDIAERWTEGIGYGARARLYDTPNTPYYNPGTARLYERKAMNEIGKGKIAANQARTRGPLMVNKRPGG